MVTAVEAKKQEHVSEQNAADIAAAAIARASATAKTAQVLNKAASAQLPGVDPMDFVRAHRIHIKDGSLFVDPYLVIHPRELAPENEAKLREKLKLTYTVNNPSFYESNDRLSVALNLAQLVPVSLASQRSKLTEEIKKYNAQVDSGADADLQKIDHDKQHPFAAIVRDTIEKPTKDPVGTETLKNGIAMYLLVREKLTQQKFLNPLTSYVSHARTPDQVLGDLESKIGVSPLAVRAAAQKHGLEGVGTLLGLDPAYVADVKAFVEHVSTHEFSHNQIEHWHLGRQLLGIHSPLAQKLSVGMDARINQKIEQFRKEARHFYDVPPPIEEEEKRVAEALSLVEPIQRALMYKLGYEIGYTPDVVVDNIAKYPGIYGLHRRAANDLRDTHGTYRIYFSGRGDLKMSMRTLVHEVAHNLWPDQFTPADVQKIDTLVASDAKRFLGLHRLMREKFHEFDTFLRAYQAGSDAEKAAIAQTTKERFAAYGVSIDEGVLANLGDANELRYLAAYAVDTLRIEGARYAKSGYDGAAERFREVISRFAELKQVELSGNPRLLQFLAPGLNSVWENHYIPHLKRVYQSVVRNQGSGIRAAATTETPKVANHPGTPVKPAADACAADGVPHPQSHIEAATAHYNGPVVAAMQALGAMNNMQPNIR